MKYLSVCSGIEAATCAWHDLNWQPEAFSEIERFPSEVLAHHYPAVPNLGDMTKFKEWNIGSIDLLVGGTPCQSFSVAGLRKGMDDPRGNLALVYLAIADRFKPKWLVWENVPGVLSSNRGRDFGAFLGALAQLGYGFAYRVLDAQYFGVAQRRRRVFVVGYLGDWRPAAAVLFESESLRGGSPPSRETREEVAGPITTRSGPSSLGGMGTDEACGGYVQPIVGALTAKGPCAMGAPEVDANHYIPSVAVDVYNQTIDGQTAATLTMACGGTNTSGPKVMQAVAQPLGIFQDSQYGVTKYDSAGTLRAGRIPEHQMVMQPIAFGAQNSSSQGDSVSTEVTPTLDKSKTPAVAIGWDEEMNARTEQSGTLLRGGQGGRHDGVMTPAMKVRRLTPTECERLQGFPDGYTDVRTSTPDGPRYKALGNSMAVPVMKWIGERIDMVEKNAE